MSGIISVKFMVKANNLIGYHTRDFKGKLNKGIGELAARMERGFE